jgi:hemerythrin-like domain-containing protein
MALAHNMLLRGLNSIYLQAPHIAPADAGDFISYAKCWVEVLEHHHKMEEDRIFPWIEEQTGEEGIMEGNVEQHRKPFAKLSENERDVNEM